MSRIFAEIGDETYINAVGDVSNEEERDDYIWH